MKKIFVALASLALVGAINVGVASANPLAEPMPPPDPKIENPATPGAPQGSEADVQQEGDHQDGDMAALDAADMNVGQQGEHEDANGAANTTTGKQDQQDQQDRNTAQEGENVGDN